MELRIINTYRYSWPQPSLGAQTAYRTYTANITMIERMPFPGSAAALISPIPGSGVSGFLARLLPGSREMRTAYRVQYRALIAVNTVHTTKRAPMPDSGSTPAMAWYWISMLEVKLDPKPIRYPR